MSWQPNLTPMARLKGAKRPISLTATSAIKPDATVAMPIPHVAMRKVSARRWEGYSRPWCSVTIQDSNAVARRVAPAPEREGEVNGPNKHPAMATDEIAQLVQA